VISWALLGFSELAVLLLVYKAIYGLVMFSRINSKTGESPFTLPAIGIALPDMPHPPFFFFSQKSSLIPLKTGTIRLLKKMHVFICCQM